MAIKAQGQITLSVVVDIEAVYRYYLLQSSTLSHPSKPTVYPPPSTWDDSEPTYVDGSTNSLYFVDCTVFCDDTFKYSEVSLSSSYEAAKQAYNLANNAQNNVDGLITRVEKTEDFADSASTKLENTPTTDEVEDMLGDYCRTEDANNNYAPKSEYDNYVVQMNTLNDRMTIDVIPLLTDIQANLAKHFEFTTDGLIIKTELETETGPHEMRLILDSDVIRFERDGVEFGYWDGEDFYTGNIYVDVNKDARFGNYTFKSFENETVDGLDLIRVGD